MSKAVGAARPLSSGRAARDSAPAPPRGAMLVPSPRWARRSGPPGTRHEVPRDARRSGAARHRRGRSPGEPSADPSRASVVRPRGSQPTNLASAGANAGAGQGCVQGSSQDDCPVSQLALCPVGRQEDRSCSYPRGSSCCGPRCPEPLVLGDLGADLGSRRASAGFSGRWATEIDGSRQVHRDRPSRAGPGMARNGRARHGRTRLGPARPRPQPGPRPAPARPNRPGTTQAHARPGTTGPGSEPGVPGARRAPISPAGRRSTWPGGGDR